MRTVGEIEYCNANTKKVIVNVPVYGRVECVSDEADSVFNTLVKSELRMFGVIEILEEEAYFIRFLDKKDVRLAVKNNDSMNICDFCNRVCISNQNCLFEWNGLFDLEEGIKGYC